jgi:NitT/TauT family transport system substrate-binding protein
VNVPQLLGAGAVDLGMGSNSFIALNLAAENVPVKAVAAFFRRTRRSSSPTRPGAPLHRRPEGRPFLLGDASVTAFWVWLKAKYGFTDAQVRSTPSTPAPSSPTSARSSRATLTSEPYTIQQQAGFAPRVFLLADEGYPGYAAMVLAPDRLLSSNPDAVRAFNAASKAGWISYLTGDPRPADALIRRDNPEMPQDVLDQARAKLAASAIVGPPAEIGRMTDARWAEFFQVASSQGVYAPTLDYKRAYTLDHLPA